MTRKELMKMDGQAVCDWLSKRGVFDAISLVDLFGQEGNYIPEVCAFAARDWCVNNGYTYEWEKQINLFSAPIDWLRAAAIVIAERENE